MLKLRQKFILT